MNRRDFITMSAIGGTSLLAPFNSVFAKGQIGSKSYSASNYKQLVTSLLQDWCDGLIKHQLIDPSSPKLHGALWCSACQKIHGRCMDSVYPFMHMAHKTGEKKYLDAAILSMEWSKNVSKDDGSWTVIPDPKSWAGITVFGAIALGESLHYHGSLLPKQVDNAWRERLVKAGDYIYENFDLTFTNINYGISAVYALNLLGRELNQPRYIKRSHELAKGATAFFTTPNKFIFGEGKPSLSRSVKGLLPVDLGYNVEETLNGLMMYALYEKDLELIELLTESLSSHVEFMLPDGAWDNSWGTRHAKWSYWGSRTTDGCQPAFGLMAHINPEFGTAAYLNTELLANCTSDGLLHGGPHYVSHGILPCIHHTFAHAKTLATMLDSHASSLDQITKKQPIPRQKEYGVKHFSELDVWLISKGNWRATVSSYDALYKEGQQKIQQATGGSLGMVWHELSGPLMVASMPKYELVEKNNQQPQPDNEDIALTPRIETYRQDNQWFTNLYDLTAKVKYTENKESVLFDIETQLKSETSQTLESAALLFQLQYIFSLDSLEIKANRVSVATNSAFKKSEKATRLVLPIIAKSDEKVTQLNENQIAILKPNSTIFIESSSRINIRKTNRSRTFNMVPGVEAIVVEALLSDEPSEITSCFIKVMS